SALCFISPPSTVRIVVTFSDWNKSEKVTTILTVEGGEMKHSALALVLLVGVIFAQSKPKTPNQGKVENEPLSASSMRAEPGRYHLLAVKAPGLSTSGSIEAYDELFLYDSTSGKVWKYEPSSFIGEKDDADRTSVDAYFSEVVIDNLHGSHDKDFMQSGNLYNVRHNARVQPFCKDHPHGWYYKTESTPGSA